MAAKSLNLEFHRQQLAEWLAAYELDCQLRETPDSLAKTPLQEPAREDARSPDGLHTVGSVLEGECPRGPLAGFASGSPDEPFLPVDSAGPAADSSYPAVGQIRLLRPTAESYSDAERPVYVLVMPAGSAGAMRLIPFSRFSIPATPQEWRTGFKKPPLAVLCLWNQRVCDRARLPKSWFVKAITPKQQTAVARVLAEPNALETYPSRRFGPPLAHPLDPRHVYLQEERMLLDALCLELDQTRSAVIEYPTSETNTPCRRAAEPPTDYTPES